MINSRNLIYTNILDLTPLARPWAKERLGVDAVRKKEPRRKDFS